eukprot:1429405-Rhodomonas_salina.1
MRVYERRDIDGNVQRGKDDASFLWLVVCGTDDEDVLRLQYTVAITLVLLNVSRCRPQESVSRKDIAVCWDRSNKRNAARHVKVPRQN